MNPAAITIPPTVAATSESGVTVRPDLMARLGVAARLNAAAQDTPTTTVFRPVHTSRLTLRSLEPRDRAEFIRVVRMSRRHLEEFCPLTNPSKDGSAANESHDEIFERHLTLGIAARQTGRAWRTVAFDRENRIVGAFNINDVSRGLENTGELVFWLAVDALRRGYAEEGVHAAIGHAFDDLPVGLGLHRLTALIAPGNDACRRLARKVGLALATDAAPAVLRLGDRSVPHNVFSIYAGIEVDGQPIEADSGGVVEGKPSIAEGLFGRGLLSILRTEGMPPSAT